MNSLCNVLGAHNPQLDCFSLGICYKGISVLVQLKMKVFDYDEKIVIGAFIYCLWTINKNFLT